MASAYVALLLFVLAAIDPSYAIPRRNPEEVLYLGSTKQMRISNLNFSRAIATPFNGHILLDVYGTEIHCSSGLPKECHAEPLQTTMEMKEKAGKLFLKNSDSHYSWTFTFQVAHTVIKVHTYSVSIQPVSRCLDSPRQRQRRKGTVVGLYEPGRAWNGYQQISVSDAFYGDFGDAAMFEYGGLIYIILGLSYDPEYVTTNVYSKVVRLDTTTETFSLSQNILTYGVSALNVFTASTVPYLVVGNSYDTAKRSSEVPLQIYRFNPTTSQLEIANEAPTVGVFALTSFMDGPNVIIVVAQAQTTAPVLVFQYDPFYNTLKVIQQLTPTALPTGLGSFHISDDFVGLSTADDMFRIYKYTGVQGLKLVYEYHQTKVRGFAHLNFTKHYLFLTADHISFLVDLVVQD